MRNPEHEGLGFETRMVLGGRAATRSLGFVNPPLVRGSTVLHPSYADRVRASKTMLEQSLIYGIEGTPTHWALEDVLAEIEGGTRCQLVSTGLAAIIVALMAYTRAGAHVLMPDCVYGPTRQFCNGMLKGFGVRTSYYRADIGAEELEALFTPETSVLFTESPGSHNFAMQDIPALAAVAHRHKAVVMLDNTWGIQHFQPFAHGVDVSIQALTKYVSGHADILMGSLTVNDDASWEKIRCAAMLMGQYASPDDVWLTLRGARTLPVRLAAQMQSGLAVARWFAGRAEVAEVLHPALPGARGHEIWKRDFSGACSLFGVVFDAAISDERMVAFVDGLRLFGIGVSWGGYESLVLPSGNLVRRRGAGPAVRVYVGLENVDDLIADLERGFALLR